MKQLTYLLLALALLSGCQGQKKIIEEKVPMYLWKEMFLHSTDREYSEFREGCADYGQKLLDRYDAVHRKERAQKEQFSRMMGYSWSQYAASMDMFNAMCGTPSKLSYDPYQTNVNKFYEQIGDFLNQVGETMAQKYYKYSTDISLKQDIDAVKGEIRTLPIEVIIDSLVGYPTSLKTINDEYVEDIAGTLVMNSFKKTKYPEISTMTYNKETTYWTVRFYGTDATVEVAVKKEKDENGQPVLDYKIIGLDTE